jgi:hypothetical protein
MKLLNTGLKTNPRLNRIRQIIWAIRILAGLTVIGIIVAIFFIFIAPKKAGLWPFWKYSSLHAVPLTVMELEFVRGVLFFTGVFVLNRLLQYFARGNFFTAANISCIKWLGALVMGDWLIAKFLDAIVFRVVTVGFGDLTKPAIGLIIILIACIMDEGRKIQEEQELTV